MIDTGSASVDSPSQTASRDNSTSASPPHDVISDVTSHPLLADQPEAVRQLVGGMMTTWNAQVASDTVSSGDDNGGTIELDVMEVDGSLASSVMPQVRPTAVGDRG